MSEPEPDCAACYRPITGRVVHDRGEPWHHECRLAHIAGQADVNADRHIAANIDQARTLAAIQRSAVAA